MSPSEFRELPHQLFLPGRHQCLAPRTQDTSWRDKVRQWYLLALHIAWSIAVAIAMLFLLDGKSFAIGTTRHVALTQSDVTTIISVCLLISKVIAGAIQALYAWRCIFILLEKAEISLADISSIATWHALLGWRRRSTPTVWAVVVILFLTWPAQVANPIASGAVSWLPLDQYKSTPTVCRVNEAAVGLPWVWYGNYSDTRSKLVKNAAGKASFGTYGISETFGNPLAARRIAPSLANHPRGTLVGNMTLPFFQIENLTWITDLTTLPTAIKDAISDPGVGFLNTTASEAKSNPVWQTLDGTAVLLQDTAWQQPSESVLPPATVFSGIKYAAVRLGSHSNHNDPSHHTCASEGTSVFDPLPVMTPMDQVLWNSITACIAVAKIGITAGVTTCDQHSFPAAGCHITRSSSGIVESNSTKVLPDPLVLQVFAMMPEVQALATAISPFGVNATGSLSGALEPYLRTSLVQAYQATWSATTDFLTAYDNSESSRSTYCSEPADALQASILAWRIYAWLGLNILLTLSGIFLVVMQATCYGETLEDSATTTLLLDSSQVVNKHNTGLCTPFRLTSRQKDFKVRLRVGHDHDLNDDDEVYHPLLVLSDQSPRASA